MNEDEGSSLELGMEAETAPGVWMERRSFFGLAAACLCAPRGSPLRRGGSLPSADAHMDLDEFLAEVVPIARDLVRDDSRVGEDRYLWTLASYAVRLADVPVPEMDQKGMGDGPKTFIGSNPGGDPFIILHWRMEPYSTIGIHAHTYGNVVTLGLAGAARVQNYEMVGERDFETPGTFLVRKNNDQILKPGDINLVPLEHGYCHGFLAGPEGARGLDITTRTRPKRSSPSLDVSTAPVDEEAQIYEASWRFE